MNFSKHDCRGSAMLDVVLGAAIIVLVILPVFSAVMEKYILINKIQLLKDAVDMTNIATYAAIEAANLGKTVIDIDISDVEAIYRSILADNLDLDENLSPLDGSIAEGRVAIESLAIYVANFPQACPDGTWIDRPSVHSRLIIPVKPSLYRQVVLGALGKEYIELVIHVDSEAPVNN